MGESTLWNEFRGILPSCNGASFVGVDQRICITYCGVANLSQWLNLFNLCFVWNQDHYAMIQEVLLSLPFERTKFFGILVFSLYCEVFDSRDNRIFRGKEVV